MDNKNQNDYYYDQTEENSNQGYQGDYARDKFNNNDPYGNSDERVYRNEPLQIPRKTRGWSVASLVLSIISVVCCCLPVLSIVVGALSILFAIISRINLGYFDGLAIAGIVVGIFGLVIGVFTVVALQSVDWEAFLEEYEKALEESMNGGI